VFSLALTVCSQNDLIKKRRTKMKKIMFIAPVALLAIFLTLGTAYAQSPGSGYGPPQQRGWYCPYCGAYQGGYGMGPGMMGYGMGPGMMGYGYGMGPGMMGPGYGYNRQYQQPQRQIKEKDAKEIVENYLNVNRNPNLKLGKIKDDGSAFEVEIVTKNNGSLVDKILVDKKTGWLRSVY
jgi:hypothetical protein